MMLEGWAMFRRIIDLVVTAAWAVCTGAAVVLNLDQPLLRAFLALPLVFVLPGYALAALIFSKWKLGRAEWLLLSVGLSLAVAALGGVALNVTPWGLTAGGWVAWLSGTTLLFAAAALAARLQAPAPANPGPGVKVRPVPAALMGVAVLVVAAAVALSRLPVPANGVQGYTQLWIWPASGAGQDVIRIGLGSSELDTVQYRLEVEMDGELTHKWDSIELKPGEVFEAAVSLPAGGLKDGPVEALLYRLDVPSSPPYRRVEYWPQ
jgi:uncharacterized membrane protein